MMKQLKVLVSKEKDNQERVHSRLHKQEIQRQTLELKFMSYEDPYTDIKEFNRRMRRYNDELLM